MPNEFQQNPNGVIYPYQQIAKQRIKQARQEQRKGILKTCFALGCTIMAYLFGQILISTLVSIQPLNALYNDSVIFKYCLTTIGISLLSMALPFFVMSRKLKSNYEEPLVPLKKNGILTNVAWICFGLGACILAQYGSAIMISIFKEFGYELKKSTDSNPDSIFACIIMIVTVAIVPGILEEFSLRCCALGSLKKYGKGFAVFIASITFGLLHMNFIQFVFAFLVGIVLGMITIKTESVIPAMFIHGINNGASVASSIVSAYGSDKVKEIFAPAFSFTWLGVGLLGVILLFLLGEFKKAPKKEKNLFDNNIFIKVLCALPGLIVPFMAMIYFTSRTITKI